MKLFPDAARTETMKRAVDRASFVGLALVCVFLVLPKMDWNRISALHPVWLVVIAIVAFAPLALVLLWLEKKIQSRRVWWSIGAVSWIACFTLALSGYHLG